MSTEHLGFSDACAVVDAFEEIADSLVVGDEPPDGEYRMPLFVVPAPGVVVDDALRERLRSELRHRLSPRHLPDRIVRAPVVPRTLTGKTLEVPVDRILEGADPDSAAAAGAIHRPDVLDWYVQQASDDSGTSR